MEKLTKRAVSGTLFATLLVLAAQNKFTFLTLLLVFGFLCLYEFNKLIGQKNRPSYVIFTALIFAFGFMDVLIDSAFGINEASQILHIISIFVSNQFFNLGFKNKWQQNLPEEISSKIKDKFFNELKELKYE